jgi:hypothetical protein
MTSADLISVGLTGGPVVTVLFCANCGGEPPPGMLPPEPRAVGLRPARPGKPCTCALVPRASGAHPRLDDGCS